MLCSFCGKSDIDGEVNYVICGPGVYICDDCMSTAVSVLGQIIAAQRKTIEDLKALIHIQEREVMCK